MDLELIYDKLFSAYGSQGWWPIKFKYSGGPTSFDERFEVVIGAILTQNCSWSNVEKALLCLEGCLDIDSILSLKDLGLRIKSTGYYNQKALRLKEVAKFFNKNRDPSRSELLGLKGVGKETADSILLYGFNKPYFVIDAYTKRIFNRLGCSDVSYDSLQKRFMDNLPKDVKIYNEYHALIVRLAKEHCRVKPLCSGCPLGAICKGLNI